MRHLAAAGSALALVLACGASAQVSNNRNPNGTSLPSRSTFGDGFSSRQSFGDGFSRGMPFGPVTAARPADRSRDNSKLIDVPQRLSPASGPVQNLGAGRPGTESHGCTGDCDHDHDANAPAHHHDEHGDDDHDGHEGEAAKPADSSPNNDVLARVKSIETAQRTAAASGKGKGDQACSYCHTNGKNPTKDNVIPGHRSRPDTRLDTRLRDSLIVTRRADDRFAADNRPIMAFGVNPVPVHAPVAPDAKVPVQSAVDNPEVIGRDPSASVDTLRDHVKANPDDFHSARLLAVSLLAAKNPREAATTLAKAYESDPLLSGEPIDLKALGFTPAQITNLVTAAATAARSSNSSQSWLLAAAMYQAQGSKLQALAALDKSRAAGLKSDVGDWLAAELKAKPEQMAKTAK